VKLGTLPEKATFGRSKKLAGRYYRGRVDLAQDFSVLIHDWEAALNAPSWLASGNETHAFSVDLSASKKASESILKHVDSLVKHLPKEVRQPVSQQITTSWMKNGKFTLSLSSRGKLSSPSVEVESEMPDVEALVEDFAKKSAVDFLLRKLGR
jgi:hypothetical protein